MWQACRVFAQVAVAPVAVLAALTAPLSAQGKAVAAPPATAPGGAPRATVVRVSAIDYAFKTPSTIPAGLVVFELDNDGADLHQLAVLELPANRTIAEFLETYHKKGIIPAWMPAVGQTQVIAPNQEALLALRITPGRYILACLMPARDGRVHTEKGMVWQVTAR
jgi:uncharacterized cupredoxin-like copper-binding protein